MSEPDPAAVPFVQEGGPQGDATKFTCALCGARFTHGTLVCVSCPLNVGCEVVKCPACGYQSPRRSRVVDFVRGVFASGGRG
jgi:predicted amidophosphoribosyltransferase